MHLGAAGEHAVPGVLRCARRRLSFRRGLGAGRSARSARRFPPARTAPRAGRWKVAGGIPHPGCRKRPGAKLRTPIPPPAHHLPSRAAQGMAKIIDVKGRRVWDSRGRATVEAEVIVGRGTTALATGRAIAPSGASTGAGEAKSIDPLKAIHNINTRINDALRALSVADQAGLDRRL